MNYVQTDEGAALTIDVAAARSLSLTLDFKRPMTGTYKLEVRNFQGTVITTFVSGSDISVQATKLIVTKAASGMTLPTGCWFYDLTETASGETNTLLKGNFIIRPSITTP